MLSSMAKEYDSSEIISEGLKQDVLWLLITVYSYVTRRRFEGLGKMSREAFVVDWVLLESAVRDIVSRLTALDDDTRNNRSFQTLFAALKREGLDSKRTSDLNRKIKTYRALVNDLKVSHRNRYIAHVNTNVAVVPRVFDNPVAFEAAASMAVNLLDDIIGSKVEYIFSMASDLKVDLRQALSNSSMEDKESSIVDTMNETSND
ncbi:hypothetical protein NBRC3280_3286 [Acetobacter pasteurianus NBRC 3280]|uniref:HEPN AbiU2-like domain-containing protein n=2 Tax=Acetobacteraceae TaxID=433 RepID=A0A401X987_ACEPA|nr:hypothetical protein NBRC3277_3263 [Acetobacter pasteurianus NBRC 3277]GCD64288.1 hypothetical protein NBRC3278_3381 [Acetobacter pasteurianus NBRC 3278]GCD70651.1 hypothetical protein NBRC3280_3286 [Acetobacter pasteurianus NBRC 3280]